jgi:hypothetical protein
MSARIRSTFWSFERSFAWVFGKSKWQSYFELLRPPTFFSQRFWFDCCLPCEKPLVLEIKRQPWLWLGPRMPWGMLEVAMTTRSRPPWPNAAEAQLLLVGGRMTKGTATPIPNVVLPLAPIFSLSKTQTIACVNITTFTATKHSSAFFPACFRNTKATHMPLPEPCISQQMQASFF